MARDSRIERAGQRLSYTCANRRFQTNIDKGNSHGHYSDIGGSVFSEPLARPGCTLWLEHVIETGTGDEYYWFMWYDEHGVSTIPMSGVLTLDDIVRMQALLAEFIR